MKQRRLIKENQKVEKAALSKKLTSKYSIRYNWDTLSFDYSVEYKLILKSKNQLIGNIRINDIYEKDSIRYVSIVAGSYPSFYLDFPISLEQESKLLSDDKDLIFVVSISEIRKLRFSLNSEIEDGEPASVSLDNSDDFIGRGTIIEIAHVENYKNK